MLDNLLAKTDWSSIPSWQTGLLTFFLGLFVTFLGMTILVLCVTGIGNILSHKDKKKENKPVTLPDLSEEKPVAVDGDDISDEVKVAIIAAISAYYSSAPAANNEFVVKKIKRLK